TGWTTCGTTCRALWPVTFVPMLRRHTSHLQSASTSDGECREGRECRECVEKCDIHAQRYQSKGPVNVVNVLRKYFARGALILPNLRRLEGVSEPGSPAIPILDFWVESRGPRDGECGVARREPSAEILSEA